MHKIFGSEVRHVQFQACVQVNCRAVCQLSSIMTELVLCGCRTSYKKRNSSPFATCAHTHTHKMYKAGNIDLHLCGAKNRTNHYSSHNSFFVVTPFFTLLPAFDY